jgi:hypothetical protein
MGTRFIGRGRLTRTRGIGPTRRVRTGRSGPAYPGHRWGRRRTVIIGLNPETGRGCRSATRA